MMQISVWGDPTHPDENNCHINLSMTYKESRYLASMLRTLATISNNDLTARQALTIAQFMEDVRREPR